MFKFAPSNENIQNFGLQNGHSGEIGPGFGVPQVQVFIISVQALLFPGGLFIFMFFLSFRGKSLCQTKTETIGYNKHPQSSSTKKSHKRLIVLGKSL